MLKNYKKITELDKIRYGAYIRWFDKNNILKKGMFICDILTTDGIIIRGKTATGKFLNIRMEECIIYQKMKKEEIIVDNIMKSLG